MPAAPPPPPAGPSFDSPEYDALQKTILGTVEARPEQIARDCLDDILHCFSLAVHEHRAHTRVVEDAVDSCLATALDVIEMQYPAREDNPVSAISLEHNSWEQEKPPDPCSFDSWLRSALPDMAPTSTSSWAMQQFLMKEPTIKRNTSTLSNGGSGSGTGGGSGTTPTPTSTGDPTTSAPPVGDGPASRSASFSAQDARMARSAAAAAAAATSGGGAGVTYAAGTSGGGAGPRREPPLNAASTRSLHPTSSRRHITKLDTRKQLTPEQELVEEQLRQELQQRKTQEEMSRRLEQKDAEERSKLASLRKELKGKDYTYDHKGEVVILNEFDPDRTPLEGLSGPGYKVAAPEDSARALSPKRRSTLQAAGGAAGGAVGGGAAGGRGAAAGAAADAPPAGAAAAPLTRSSATLSPTEMRKERDRRLASDFKKMQPKTQPSAMDTLMPAGGVTLRGAGGVTKSGPLRPAQQGITREAYAKQVAKKALQAQLAEAAAAAGGGGSGSPGTPTRGHSAMNDPPGSTRSTRSTLNGVGARSLTARSTGSGTAARVAALLAEGNNNNNNNSGSKMSVMIDPLAAYEDDRFDPFAGARPRARGQSSQPLVRTSTPDVNLSLTSAGDWGSAGLGRVYEAPQSLPHSKPTEKQLVETVGRGERLPRERAPLPTLAPPLSPSKAGLPKSSDRLQFHSVLAE
ncbi:hypothetical protein Agub_g5472 [Astrephomene gubernaculifera]|uniref:Uncharacterized protein n=1 Tax=Astrephomene gubernaculifera TaxID=47775 RepID=A0AAD3DP03_9CHLO|nr:hypothetical protein Agub_g5472 [Astrephomene gubernaculifera]